jgi:hypothetical protein
MAHFRAEIQGMRGPASRLGSKSSGINIRLNGWDSGVYVTGHYDAKMDADVFEIFGTSGSNGGRTEKLLGQYVDGVFHPA